MFNIDSSEFLLVAIVALVVIGPKDLPKAMRVVGYWVGKARGVSRQFRQGFDNMVREAELEEMEKRWAAENERIMREHAADTPPAVSDAVPATSVDHAHPAIPALPDPHAAGEAGTDHGDHSDRPVMVEKPVVGPAPVEPHAPRANEGASS
ncbi:twin arginine-targeting protein translocase TatB [Sphingomonas sp. S17]|jgi:sec-independent protein translocase protein TatB|uniref:Twin-arginine translocase subunit TatB n=2 Tax=Sphingomonas paucimobilis TaxID=13689 RepID=A0A411LHV7_SPHPI|nr:MULTISPECIES: Sec-independent protein translocase protein TatB [Sphingomonas]EGI54864.1 twin arginine-targeting protein translocase TatB [Sphingomonas sp. S17]MBQ1479445.1 twin-arginine translocase subunit TatB [Sphingomonas sp.]MCM3678014.1 Sec-independent protein translocase protein TatB [Sphingomonas paucimobilis]MDG5972646.1 Sec-independent protein translocase protein TatB [Sphingomonas paucimobilis]NNG56620.1 twin-arginine translocase subunit TatB [Sphingomonas paucimobilis]